MNRRALDRPIRCADGVSPISDAPRIRSTVITDIESSACINYHKIKRK